MEESARPKTSHNNKFSFSLAWKDSQATPTTLSQVWLGVSASEIRDVSAPSKAWHYWQGESPCMERSSQPLLSSDVPLLVTTKVKRTQRII